MQQRVVTIDVADIDLTAIGNLRRLQLFRSISQTNVFRQFDRWQRSGSTDAGELLGRLAFALSQEERAFWAARQGVADPWEAWLIDRILSDDNPWTRQLERKVAPDSLLDAMARHDLTLLSRARQGLQTIARAAGQQPLLFGNADETHSASRQTVLGVPLADERRRAAQRLSSAAQWSDALETIKTYIAAAGAGPFNRASAFVWEGDDAPGLSEVRALDPTRLEDLVGYHRERGKVLENTERLIAGLPAHNLLLYGDRGTGKSATVKALVHRYADEGLRVIELSKRHLHTLPKLTETLRPRGLAFVLFVDDLSFDAAETDYKEVKAFLEGSLRHPPSHVRVYATSNRRHLIHESFSERAGGPHPDDDVRKQDTMQEKLSLADRFGMTVIFASPGQQQYLEIVRGLAESHGLDMPLDILEQRALQWAAWQNGRSARTARQFIESLIQK